MVTLLHSCRDSLQSQICRVHSKVDDFDLIPDIFQTFEALHIVLPTKRAFEGKVSSRSGKAFYLRENLPPSSNSSKFRSER